VGIPLAWVAGFAVAVASTPLAIRIAVATDFYDRPAGYKAHRVATPYLGGAAVLAGLVVAAVVSGAAGSRLIPIVIGAAVLWAIGTLDDRFGLMPLPRVLAELAVAAFLWESGLGWSLFDSEVLNFATTLLWVVAVVISFSLLDNIDGATAGVAAAAAGGVCAVAALHGDTGLAALALGLCGACVGFLRHNLAAPRARIFLGDGGSMVIGFVLAAITMRLPLGDEPAAVSAAVLLVGVAMTDTALVVVSRRRRGVALVTAGRDHLTHRLLAPLGSARSVAFLLGGVQAALAALAIAALELSTVAVVATCGTCIALAALSIAALERSPWAAGPAAQAADDPGDVAEAAAEERAGTPAAHGRSLGRAEA
jgi:UDP-GlcNAc:undecaprenyl-phosphate GlcNAc-1-phosphate transferase